MGHGGRPIFTPIYKKSKFYGILKPNCEFTYRPKVAHLALYLKGNWVSAREINCFKEMSRWNLLGIELRTNFPHLHAWMFVNVGLINQ